MESYKDRCSCPKDENKPTKQNQKTKTKTNKILKHLRAKDANKPKLIKLQSAVTLTSPSLGERDCDHVPPGSAGGQDPPRPMRGSGQNPHACVGCCGRQGPREPGAEGLCPHLPILTWPHRRGARRRGGERPPKHKSRGKTGEQRTPQKPPNLAVGLSYSSPKAEDFTA